MIDVQQILELQADTVARWHSADIENCYSGYLQLVCQQHIFNFELWHQEDIARSREVTNEKIAEVKRAIDRLNQARNDHIEKIDDWLTAELANAGIQPQAGAKQNTETPGSVIDRLSIMSLRLYHYREQLERDDVESEHVARVNERIALCEEQRRDLSRSLNELLQDIQAGRKVHKTYRQMKMYNDPTLNPYLYKAGRAQAVSS
ncbi:MAG: DUF4254 domain-containing protein [Pirellulaceae bacterium]